AVRARLAAALGNCLLQRGQAAEALAIAAHTIAALPTADALLRAQLTIVRSNASFMLTRYDETEQLADQALALLAQLSEAAADTLAPLQAQAHNLLGLALKMRGEVRLASGHWERAVAYARSARLRQLENRTLLNLGNLSYEQGDLAGAQRRYEQALAGAEAVADSYTVGRIVTNLGNIHLARGEPAAALGQLDQALAIKQRTGDRRGLLATNIQRARALLALGSNAEAHILAEQIQAQAEQSGEARLQAHALLLLGQIQLYEGLPSLARDSIQAGLSLPGIAGDLALREDLHNYLVLALIACGDSQAARRYLADQQVGASVEVAMERVLIGGVLALASGEAAAVGTAVQAVVEQATSTGYLVYASLARRLAAAAAPPINLLPRLLLGPDPQG
ncbi:MAG TPA: tetratricopeptide repeat protein, partial [Roseiflexaceae bacterium]|nr:tetratricopeptide repeat protein [Roseiflexaceae bacterium]